MKKTIVIGADHAGYPMKQFLLQQLTEAGCSVEDAGTYDEASCNTQPYAQKVGAARHTPGKPHSSTRERTGLVRSGTRTRL